MRIDYYIVDGALIFGEMTFTPGAGFTKNVDLIFQDPLYRPSLDAVRAGSARRVEYRETGVQGVGRVSRRRNPRGTGAIRQRKRLSARVNDPPYKACRLTRRFSTQSGLFHLRVSMAGN